MDNQVGALVVSRFFLVSHENDVWGYSSVVKRMVRIYEVLGSISSLNYLFPSVSFLYFRKTSIGLERFYPKWTIRQEDFCCQDFFVFALTISVVERMLCMYDVLGSIPSISSLNYLSQVLRHQLDWRGFSRNGQLGRSNFGVKIFLDLP